MLESHHDPITVGPAVPAMTDSGERGDRPSDIYSRLLSQRIVFLGKAIDEEVAAALMAQLLHLEAQDPERDIAMYINSPGGDSMALFAIYDTMQYVRPEVATYCVGQAASAAAVLLAAGEAGKRFALPNARILIHQPHGGIQGQSVDMEIAGYSVVSAADVDAAAELAQGCPLLQRGGGVEIAELTPLDSDAMTATAAKSTQAS